MTARQFIASLLVVFVVPLALLWLVAVAVCR